MKLVQSEAKHLWFIVDEEGFIVKVFRDKTKASLFMRKAYGKKKKV